MGAWFAVGIILICAFSFSRWIQSS